MQKHNSFWNMVLSDNDADILEICYKLGGIE